MIEKDFVTEGLKRTRIDEYLENELERAGYGGMEIQITPLGTMVVVYAERPGMVIGRGGKTVRNITQTLKSNYGLENPQVEVKEVETPEAKKRCPTTEDILALDDAFGLATAIDKIETFFRGHKQGVPNDLISALVTLDEIKELIKGKVTQR